MRNLELHYQDFMRDSQDSQLFGPHDRMQIEGDYSKTTQYYDNLLRSVEKGQFHLHTHEQTQQTSGTLYFTAWYGVLVGTFWFGDYGCKIKF